MKKIMGCLVLSIVIFGVNNYTFAGTDTEIKTISEQEYEWLELEEKVKNGDPSLFPTDEDLIKTSEQKAGYPTRKGTVLVTKEFKDVVSLTGHAGIIYDSNFTIESFPKIFSPKNVDGVYKYDNDWDTRYKNNTYAVNVRGTTQGEDNDAADYSYRRYIDRKPYNKDFFDIETGAKFYCSQLVYKAFKVMNGVNINHNGGIVYPIDLVNSSNTYIVWNN